MTNTDDSRTDTVTEPPRPACPFRVGDRIRSSGLSTERATVTEITERGFRYRLDHVGGIPRLGLRWEEGECFGAGYHCWETVPASEDGVLRLSVPLAGSHTLGQATSMEFLLLIRDLDGRELVRIERDGKVVSAYPGAEEAAAKVFWQSISVHGTDLVSRVKTLEKRLSAYETVEPYVI